MPTTAALNAVEALRARFAPAELPAVAALPYPEVVRQARTRRAEALVASCWVETPESARETPVIQAMGAFVLEVEALVGSETFEPWSGGLLS